MLLKRDKLTCGYSKYHYHFSEELHAHITYVPTCSYVHPTLGDRGTYMYMYMKN